MKNFIVIYTFSCLVYFAWGQSEEGSENSDVLIQAQLHIGGSNPPNTDFPDLKSQTGLTLNIGRRWLRDEAAWANFMRSPRTYLSLALTDLGNKENAGYAFSILPSVEFPLCENKDSWTMAVAFGAAHITKVYHEVFNPQNKAVTLHTNWTFRTAWYKRLFHNEQTSLRAGFAYMHFSNGHLRLPNYGINSFVLTMSAEFGGSKDFLPHKADLRKNYAIKKHLGLRTGYGKNVFSRTINDPRMVNTLTLTYGYRHKEALRLSTGIYFRKYQNYKDFILGGDSLVTKEHPELMDRPNKNAMAVGLVGQAEFIMGHVGAEIDLGFNLFKPAYKLDWQINEGHYSQYRHIYVYGELDNIYKLKYRISNRLALNYYLFHVEREPKINVYLSAALNANFGQADFTELSIGLTRNFGNE